jgi:glycyl-tRNA synthetase beta chain
VIGGNERVVRPRLADAKFFFDQDRKKTLAPRAAAGQGGLPQQAGHAGRARASARAIARAIGEQLGGATLAAQAGQAAQLAKADLLTDMVGEFPSCRASWAATTRCTTACRRGGRRHRRPLQAPLCRRQPAARPVGTVVALADKLETLVGMFGIGNLPTGDRDPFALRRHALGVIRMLVEKQLPLDLPALLDAAPGPLAR